MFKKVSTIIFILVFLAMIGIPLAKTNLRDDTISESENRTLTPKAKLMDEDGSLNGNFTADFENWLNDNLGFRLQMVSANAKMQYHLFDILPTSTSMYLGPNGELNYATGAILADYQHKNLYDEEYLKYLVEGMQGVYDYARANGAQYYYFQCWDKHSIYPEQFPNTVYQYGDISKTDAIVEAIEKYSDIPVISCKQSLLEAKSQYDTYSVWGDPTHWTQRGAYIGYLDLMNALNRVEGNSFPILSENDYEITMTDQGYTVSGGIHQIDMEENFVIKNPKAVATREKLTVWGSDQRHQFYTNESVDNHTRVLIMGDSYFNSYLIDDLAESFYETLIIWGDYSYDYERIIAA